MARPYPRFIYSDPQDTKSSGPFIVHTLHPQLIGKVTLTTDGFHQVDALKVFVDAETKEVDQVMYAMHDWLMAKRMKESEVSADYYERASIIAYKLAQTHFFSTGKVSIGMTFLPKMGSRLEVAKDGWNIEIQLSNEETYHSAVAKLGFEYERKYSKVADWPL